MNAFAAKIFSYKNSGVDIDKANKFVKAICKMVRPTRRKEVICDIGGFSGLFSIPKRYKNPVLVSSTDGIGTKLLLADLMDKHNTIGIDLVAMSVNDVIVTGAEPLFFLDYFATGKLKTKKAIEIVKGIVKGCKLANCALLGGETAELPGMYRGEEYDLAGFCVGIVERDDIIDGRDVQIGDRILGIQSSGLHSNGFSLVRKIFNKDELKRLGYILLRPTIIYSRPILALKRILKIKSIAHITGGGFCDNIPRVIPKSTSAFISKDLWDIPDIFKLIQKKAKIDDREMFRTFNMGIGMVLVVSKENSIKAQRVLKNFKLKSWVIGNIVSGGGEVII